VLHSLPDEVPGLAVEREERPGLGASRPIAHQSEQEHRQQSELSHPYPSVLERIE
jgi:hypothetical protein